MIDISRGASVWEKPFHQGARLTFWLLALGICAGVTWAYVARVQVYALAQGVLEPQGQMLQLRAPSSGRTTKVSAELWTEVKENEVLFELDAAGSSVEESALQIDLKRAELEDAVQGLALSEEALAQAQRIRDQEKTLWEAGAIPKNDYVLAEETLSQAAKTLAQARARLEVAELTLKQLENSTTLKVKSPARGRLTELGVCCENSAVNRGDILAVVLPDEVPLVFKAAVREADRAKFKLGAPAEIAWNSFPKQKYGVTRGVVTKVSPTSTDTDGVLLYQIFIELSEETISTSQGQRLILPGMAGEARIISKRQRALSLFWDWLKGANPWE